jgi:predicted nucleic acid-binding protein
MICFDANVLIEIILGRDKALICREFVNKTSDDLAVTILSLDLVMYYAEKHKLNLEPIEQFLRTFLWLPLTEADAESAFQHYKADDFEDALQISCAVRESCATFVTLDKALVKKYHKDIRVKLL